MVMNACSPDLAVKFYTAHTSSVQIVLCSVNDSQIGSPVIQPVPVYVVYFLATLCMKQKAMEIFESFANSSSGISFGMQVPNVLFYSFSIGIVDDGFL